MSRKKDGINVITLLVNGDRTFKFDTDVANDYFDRVEESGELQLALLQIKHNEKKGGDRAGRKKEISDLLNIVKSSPNNEKIVLNTM